MDSLKTSLAYPFFCVSFFLCSSLAMITLMVLSVEDLVAGPR